MAISDILAETLDSIKAGRLTWFVDDLFRWLTTAPEHAPVFIGDFVLYKVIRDDGTYLKFGVVERTGMSRTFLLRYGLDKQCPSHLRVVAVAEVLKELKSIFDRYGFSTKQTQSLPCIM